MSDAVQVALITQFGLIIVGIITIIGKQIGDRSRSEQHHQANTERLDDLVLELGRLKQELPDGGLSTWISTVRNNTDAIKEQSHAMAALAGVVTGLRNTVDQHSILIKRLMGSEVT